MGAWKFLNTKEMPKNFWGEQTLEVQPFLIGWFRNYHFAVRKVSHDPKGSLHFFLKKRWFQRLPGKSVWTGQGIEFPHGQLLSSGAWRSGKNWGILEAGLHMVEAISYVTTGERFFSGRVFIYHSREIYCFQKGAWHKTGGRCKISESSTVSSLELHISPWVETGLQTHLQLEVYWD